jgi:protein-L-isoaspartate O-methyltransferase
MRETSAMRRAAVVAIGALLGVALWWRRKPSAMPTWQRFLVELPHPGITRERLIEVLEPRPKERLLEVGPGTGYYALTVAERLDRGRLEVYDLQKEMVDHVMRRAGEHGLANVTGWTGDAQQMLFEDNRFDGAYLTVVLGEIPDQDRALAELARVVKPGGRVVVGEIALDPHYVTFGSLRARADGAGLEFERRLGGAFAYFARFRVRAAA